MRDALAGCWRHLLVRLRAVATDPESAVLMLGFGLAAALTPTIAFGLHVVDGGAGAAESLDLIGWLWLWPAVPAVLVAGRSTAGPGGTPFVTRALPALPVGLRARALAEVAVAIVVTVAVWAPFELLIRHGDLSVAGPRMLASLLLLIPTLAAWTIPSSSPGMTMVRPFAVAVVLGGTAQLGWLSSPPGLLAASLGLLVLVLAVGDREPARLLQLTARMGSARRARPGLAPEKRLIRDTFEQPLRLFGPWVLAASTVLAAALVLELNGRLPVLALFVAAELVLIPLLIASLRPLGSELIGMALTGKHGGRRGDFARALAVLPIRSRTWLCSVWLQALVLAAAVWLLALGLFALHTWLDGGRWALIDRDGDSLVRLLLGFGAIIPCHAAFVLAAAVGHRVHMVVSGVCWLLAMHGGPLLLLAADRLAGRASAGSIALQVAVLVVVAALGGVPPLAHLRRAPERFR